MSQLARRGLRLLPRRSAPPPAPAPPTSAITPHLPPPPPSSSRQSRSIGAAAGGRRALSRSGAPSPRPSPSSSSHPPPVAPHDPIRSAAAFDTLNGYDRESSDAVHFGGRDPVEPRAVSPRRVVPPDAGVDLPPYARLGIVAPSLLPERISIHDGVSADRMRRAARTARGCLDLACSLAAPGVTTDSIDEAVHDAIVAGGAYPSPLNYAGFPKSLCSSVNEVICHGIPDSRELRRGDVVSFDVSCFVGGVHGDNCATVIVGDNDDDDNNDYAGERDKLAQNERGSPRGKIRGSVGAALAAEVADGGEEDYDDDLGADWRGVPHRTNFSSPTERLTFVTARRLVRAAKESLDAAIYECRPGGCLSRIGDAVQSVCDAYGYDTVRKYRGHGIGTEFHCSPFVKHYRNDDALELRPGMIFTIEPMITEGRSDCTEWADDWTVVTMDGGRAAQFEHTVLITRDGVEVLTVPE